MIQAGATNVWGPSKVSSPGGSCYVVTFIAYATRELWVCSMKNKSDLFDVFEK